MQCRRYLLPDKTYCGLLRFAFGQGRERRVKIVFLTFTGAVVGVSLRARANTSKAFMKGALGPSSLDVQATNPLELDLDAIIDKLKKIAGSGVVGVEEAGGGARAPGGPATAPGRQASSAVVGEGDINVRRGGSASLLLPRVPPSPLPPRLLSPPPPPQLATYLKAMEEEIRNTGNVFDEDEGLLDMLFPKEKTPTV